ncbi:zinc finger protein 362-like isoform X1 [Acipenser oxyrinchus oxyrinchus]|uniref:Zinc finger protein 362-like isoform X1 n=1 Tax=Acipenser oxyrinchus oxyrinchus TaxID=40147 RepID=A0AAD8CUW5_ACIOX|nr:zinc finger protein 362-like isoform X1 [Acipenser oxyrinchus oxyrinchus]
MAESRFNNPYFWPPPPSMPSQLDNLVLINKIKEQLMAEKIRLRTCPHLCPFPAALAGAPSPSEGGQHMMSIPSCSRSTGSTHMGPRSRTSPYTPGRASSTVSGLFLGDVNFNLDDKTSVKAKGLWEDWHLRQIIDQPTRMNHLSGLTLSSRCGGLNTSEAITPTTPTSSSQSRLGGASSPNLISGLASGPGLEPIKSGGLSGLLGAPPKPERGRKKIKAENSSGPLLVVPYPILASGNDQSTVTIASKEGKTYRCKVCPLTFFTKSDMQMHSKSHTEAKPHKCPHCSKSRQRPTWHSTCKHSPGPSPTTALTARSPSASSLTCSSTQGFTLETGHINALIPAAKKLSLSSPTYSLIRDNTTKTSRTSVPTATGLTRTQPRCRSTCLHTPSRMPRLTAAACAAAYTSETYLMKHMSKHTVVEHLVNHHSPPRTESPSIPIRISLI